MKVENKTKKTVTSALFYVLYVALAVVFLAPLLFLFVSSVKSETQLVSDMATLKAFIPYGNLTLENYVAVFEKLDFLHYFRNSAVNAIIQVFVGMFINGMMGYALGMLEFRGQKLLVSLMIALTIIPTEAVIINRFMVAFNLGIINTIWALAIPNLATPMYVFLFYQHFRGMPKDLLEAAIIDGSTHVFDTATFTVNGETVTSAPCDMTIMDWATGTVAYQGETYEGIVDGAFEESTFRSAPYFTLRIDGIVEDAQ